MLDSGGGRERRRDRQTEATCVRGGAGLCSVVEGRSVVESVAVVVVVVGGGGCGGEREEEDEGLLGVGVGSMVGQCRVREV